MAKLRRKEPLADPICLRLPQKTLDKMDAIIENGYALSRAEYMRVAIINAISDDEKRLL